MSASFGRFGWQNTPIIFLGHGLLSVANRQETMLLIAHELMHVRESGWDQSRLIKMTWGGFERLHYAISLQWISPALVQFTLMRMLLAPTTLILLMMRTCLAVEQRHLERRADKAALQFCNRTAMQTLLKKSAYVYVPPIQSAYDQAAPSQKYDAICASEASIEPAKFDRLWQAIHSAETKIFDKHPSASERIQASKDPSIVRIRAIIEPRDYRRLQLELKRWPVWLVQRQYQFASVASNDSITLQPALEA